MFSIYTSGFNLVKNEFAFEEALDSFDEFAEEVVIAVNTSEDGTLEEVEKLQKVFLEHGGNLQIVKTDFSYDDPDLDGKVKNAALQATTQEFKIGLDLDERIPLGQRPLWEKYAYALSQEPEAGSILIPVANLYRDRNHVKDIGSKWYLHKHGLYRGVVDFARNPDGTHDIEKSDSCELINENGQLVKAMSALPAYPPVQYLLPVLETGDYPFVVHWGYVNLDTRVKRNVNFWKRHWSVEAGREVDIPTTLEALSGFEYHPHNLVID